MRCAGCGRSLSFDNDPDNYLEMSDVGCRAELAVVGNYQQAYCQELGRYV